MEFVSAFHLQSGSHLIRSKSFLSRTKSRWSNGNLRMSCIIRIFAHKNRNTATVFFFWSRCCCWYWCIKRIIVSIKCYMAVYLVALLLWHGTSIRMQWANALTRGEIRINRLWATKRENDESNSKPINPRMRFANNILCYWASKRKELGYQRNTHFTQSQLCVREWLTDWRMAYKYIWMATFAYPGEN